MDLTGSSIYLVLKAASVFNPRKNLCKRFLYPCLTAVCLCSSAVLSLGVFGHGVVGARTQPLRTFAHIEIDGVDYGSFGAISSLADVNIEPQHPDEAFFRVHLTRDFVTHRSLALWAGNSSESQESLKDIRLSIRNEEGQELNHYVMRMCKPLSWSVEVADPEGGFHEKVQLAVPHISVY